MSKFSHPIPPDFTLSSGLVITHYTEQTPKGIRLRAEPLETIRRLSVDERADYTSQLVSIIPLLVVDAEDFGGLVVHG